MQTPAQPTECVYGMRVTKIVFQNIQTTKTWLLLRYPMERSTTSITVLEDFDSLQLSKTQAA
jgi:hypothetical protein